MAEEMQFVNGLIVKAPHANAPSFVKASISIKVTELAEWLKGRSGEEWINVDVKESKGGKWYAAVSTFKPKESAPAPAPAPAKAKTGGVEDIDSEIPFAQPYAGGLWRVA